jgi:adenylate kinase
MNIILFGPQGSGKGTQADLLVEKYKLYHLSMGDELRKEIKKGTPLGKKISKIVNRGDLVPSKITNNISLKISKRKECKNGIIFDGYPRSMEQWIFLKNNFKIGATIEIILSEKESVRRIASRRVCPKCGHNYNTIWLKPKISRYCDIDHAKLIHREDDKPLEIKRRLKIYHTQTEPLKKEYKKQKILYTINGARPIKLVNNEIVKILKNIYK